MATSGVSQWNLFCKASEDDVCQLTGMCSRIPAVSEIWPLCAVICVSIVCGLILLCLLRRVVQHYYPNALLIYPVAPRMQRRSPPGEHTYSCTSKQAQIELPDLVSVHEAIAQQMSELVHTHIWEAEAHAWN